MLNTGQGSIGPGDTEKGIYIYIKSATLLSMATVSQNHFRNRPVSFLKVVGLFFFFFLSAACIGSFSQKPAALVGVSILLI